MSRLRIALMLPLLALAGCYGSEAPLFPIEAGSLPLPAATYESSDGTYSWKISIDDGHYRMPNGLSQSDVVLVPLAGKPGAYLVERGEQGGFSYAVLYLRPGNGFSLIQPNCQEVADRKAAEGLGKVEGTRCTFENPRSLANALSNLADNAPAGRWINFSPKG